MHPLAADYPHLTPYNNAGNKVINTIDIDGMQGGGETTKPEEGNQESGNGGRTLNAYEIELGSITIIDPHQAPPPEPMEKMQPKGFANDATRVAPVEERTPLTPKQAYLERAANISKMAPNQGGIDYPSNDMRSRKFQAFDTYNPSRQTDRAFRQGVEIGETVTGAYSIITLAKSWKSITSWVRNVFKKSDDATKQINNYDNFGDDSVDDFIRLSDNPLEFNNTIPEGKQANHIFSKNAGKLADTPENRKLLEEFMNAGDNYLGKNEFGQEWFAKILDNGTQLYGYSKNGVIKGAGINQTPLNIVANKNLR